ncbi:halocarboxylic acid dehydrogenase DehI family protein [Marinobacter fonticola]|uniref:halocarboxylic acid dehydrogenase DehI family protein n=1 Tax=Marinobacter fonticola TaxID=2603215 RepID=UPI0011E7729C|nr:halocarboxylic acid dehydrogenase DehI family protein [Marinobacter fonticola]
MAGDQESLVQQGMKLAVDLPDIMPEQADARLKEIYEDIQQTLRVPIVNKIFRALANYPDYLEEAWGQVRPIARTIHFEEASGDIRAQALLKGAPVSAVMDLTGLDNPDKLQAFNDTIHYVLPKLLLIVTFFHKAAFEDQIADVATSPELLQSLPSGIAQGAAKVQMVDPEKADVQVRQLFEDIKSCHGHSLVSSYYRGLGQWPDFLQHAWEQIRPYVGSEEYIASRLKLIGKAHTVVDSWPTASVKLSPIHQEEIRAILTAFQLKFIPDMLLDAALIQALLGGREAALMSPLSVTT